MNTTNASNANNANNASNALTQSELQSLKSHLKSEISALEYDIQTNKEILGDLFISADPDDKQNGEFFFQLLNSSRNTQRHLKKTLKRLTNLQKSVKRILSGR